MAHTLPAKSQILSVSEIVKLLHHAVSTQVGMRWVEGEVSNLRIPKSGHMYFTLKDAGANLSCALYKFRLPSCQIKPENGLKVRILGEASVFQAYGELQLLVQQVIPAGRGELNEKFEALKRKLEEEGLFDASHKKEIPSFPLSIGIITAETGAVIEDIRHTLTRRAPWIKAYLLPVGVQGQGNEKFISDAINMWGQAPNNGLPPVDVLIVGRGGGSLEDLWNFNEEIVARAIFNCPIPIISAVGHERDFTIADFVADLRAPTPTAAAELASPDGPSLLNWLNSLENAFQNKLEYKLHTAKRLTKSFSMSRLAHTKMLLAPYHQQLDYLEQRLESIQKKSLYEKSQIINKIEQLLHKKHPETLNTQRKAQVNQLEELFDLAIQRNLHRKQNILDVLTAKISAHNPENTLKRGFSLLKDKKGKLIRSINQVKIGDNLLISLSDGQLESTCTHKTPSTN